MGLFETIQKNGVHYSYEELSKKFNCSRKSVANYCRFKNLGVEVKEGFKIYTDEEIEQIKIWRSNLWKREEEKKTKTESKNEEVLPEELKGLIKIDYHELSAKTGKSWKTISNFVLRNNLGKCYKCRRFLSEEELELILNCKSKPLRQKKKIYWKLSVFDSELCKFIVKRCGLSEAEAKLEENKLVYMGYMVRTSPQYSKKVKK